MNKPHEGENPISGRCAAHNRKGERCKNSAIPGGTVCRFHGGAAPQVKRAATERMLKVIGSALELLQYKIENHSRDMDGKTALAVVTDLSELVETLEGRVARREEHVSVSEFDREVGGLLAEMDARDKTGVLVSPHAAAKAGAGKAPASNGNGHEPVGATHSDRKAKGVSES